MNAPFRGLHFVPYTICLLPLTLFVVTMSADDIHARPKNIEIRWNSAALQGVRDARMGAPMAARALAIVHTCMYDAWAAYDQHALGTQLHGALRLR
jgi:hypothetical protein